MYKFDEADGYRKKIDEVRSRLNRVKKAINRFPDSRFVADYVDEVFDLTNVVEERLGELLRLVKLEEEAGQALENSNELYKSMRRIYGALLLRDFPEEALRIFFPRGLPHASKIPVETLRVMGNRLCGERDGILADHKDVHPLIDEVRFHLEDSRSLAAAEVSVSGEAIIARQLLAQATANLDSALSVMFHLAKADNVLFPGLYRAIYRLESTPDEVPLLGEIEDSDPRDEMVMEGGGEEPLKAP